MSQSFANTNEPLGSLWDVEFTRLSAVVRQRLMRCMSEVSTLLSYAGLTADADFRVHEGGLSGSLTVNGQNRNLASLEFHLVDGMTEARVRGAALDVNICGPDAAIVAFCSPVRRDVASCWARDADLVLATAGQALNCSSLYSTLVEHFDLVREEPRMLGLR